MTMSKDEIRAREAAVRAHEDLCRALRNLNDALEGGGNSLPPRVAGVVDEVQEDVERLAHALGEALC